MQIGPRFNNISRSFTTRDNLGIESVTTMISGDLCPVVNTVTPRPFYWAFLTWAYWKYGTLNHRIEINAANLFIRRQNFFFGLASLISGNNEVGGFVGVTNVSRKVNLEQSVFSFDNSYLQGGRNSTDLGAMGYYYSGLSSLNLITDQVKQDDTVVTSKNEISISRPRGVSLAEAFDKIISKTEYYRRYLNAESDVPREVLNELGKTVRISLIGFDDCQRLLKEYLFSIKELELCRDYILYIKSSLGIDVNTAKKCRLAFYDCFSPMAKNHPITDKLKDVADGWEVEIARQYFVLGLEIIWKYMLNSMNELMSKDQWIIKCLTQNRLSVLLDERVDSYAERQLLDAEGIENQLENEKKNDKFYSVECGLNILFSVYNRLASREDYSNRTKTYYQFGEPDAISFLNFFSFIDEMKSSTIKEFLQIVMKKYLINQHLNTAFAKMLDNKDGFYIREVNGKYFTNQPFDWNYQGNRMVQLYSVIMNLGV